jgi:hypothetical protein
VGLTAEAPNAAEAIDPLSELVQSRLLGKAKQAEMTFAAGEPAWKQDAGYLQVPPLYQPNCDAME